MKTLLTTLNSKYIHSNLALRYLKNACDANDIETSMFEFTINNSTDYIFTELVAGEYDVVCFSCYIWNIEMTLDLCENLKKASPNTKIVLGGPEVSFDPKMQMQERNFIDYILLNEGEETIVTLLKTLMKCSTNEEIREEIKDSDGVAFWEDDERKNIKVNPKLKLIDFANVPFPYGDGFEDNKVIYYESTRGCPFNCSYCMSSIDKTVRALPYDRVIRELKFFLKRNVKQVKFLDRTFNWDMERANNIWKYLIENDNGKTNFHFEICADNIKEDTLELVKTARPGLFQFEVGIQSTAQETLDSVDRTASTEEILKNVKIIVKNKNIHTHVDLIAGLPYEGFERFKESFNDIYEIGAEAVQLGFLKLLKGTEIRLFEKEHEYVYESKAPYQIIGNKYISPLEIAKLKKVENVLDIYYNRGGYFRSVEKIINIYGKENKKAFDFYMELADYYYENGYQHKSHKKENQYRIFNDFAKTKLKNEEDYKEFFIELQEDLEKTMNFDAVKKFNKKGWDILQ